MRRVNEENQINFGLYLLTGNSNVYSEKIYTFRRNTVIAKYTRKPYIPFIICNKHDFDILVCKQSENLYGNDVSKLFIK